MYNMAQTAIWLSLLICLTGSLTAHAQSEQLNPKLLNIREVQPSVHFKVYGNAPSLTLSSKEILDWLSQAMDQADFGSARWTGFREDSIAYLDVNVQVVPYQDSTYLATVILQVLRPSLVLFIPPDDAIIDAPVMQAAYTLAGTENNLYRRLPQLIQQFVTYTAQRIRFHNPATSTR